MAKVEPPFTSEGSPSMHAPYAGIPTATVAQSGLWDETMRDGLAKPRFKKKDLDARRADQLIPGTPLTVTPQDARIPVILIQRSVVSTAKANSPSSSTTPGIHGWLLLIPTGWSMPFLSSLLFTGARVGGLRELAVQAFEAGIPSFPADAVDTAVYDDEVEVRAEALGERWLRTPPAKKINYEDRGIDDPWRPDWRGLLGLDPSIKNDDDDAQFVAAQRETATISHSAAPDAELKVVPEGEEVISVHALLDEPTGLALRLWLLRGQDMWTTTSVLAARANPSVSLFEQLNDQRRFRGLEPLTSSAQDVWRSALVNVRYEMCGRGRPNEGSMVFWLDEPEVWSWLKLFDKRKVSEGVAETVDEQEVI
jgi:ribonuclease P/MRP protein subunit POP1